MPRNTQSKFYMLSLTECVREFQNNALWDTHLHALLYSIKKCVSSHKTLTSSSPYQISCWTYGDFWKLKTKDDSETHDKNTAKNISGSSFGGVCDKHGAYNGSSKQYATLTNQLY